MVIDLDAGAQVIGVEIISPGCPFARHLATAGVRYGIDPAAVTAIDVGTGREP